MKASFGSQLYDNSVFKEKNHSVPYQIGYEIEFYVATTEYDMDVDAYTGMVTDFSCEPHFGFGDYDDDWNDWFDWD